MRISRRERAAPDGAKIAPFSRAKRSARCAGWAARLAHLFIKKLCLRGAHSFGDRARESVETRSAWFRLAHVRSDGTTANGTPNCPEAKKRAYDRLHHTQRQIVHPRC